MQIIRLKRRDVLVARMRPGLVSATAVKAEAVPVVSLEEALRNRRSTRTFRTGPVTVVLHGPPPNRNAPDPRRNSGGAFETGATKFGHPVQHTSTNPGLRFVILKAARF